MTRRRWLWPVLLVLGIAAWMLKPVTVHRERDVVFSTVNGVPLRLDLSVPQMGHPVPVVVLIHGGGWQLCDKDHLGSRELERAGFATASIEYRLAPRYQFPCCIEDCKAAVRFLRACASRWALDPNRIGVWGNSSGGHLAALLALAGPAAGWDVGDHLESSSQVQAVVDCYGPSSLPPLHQSTGIVHDCFGDSTTSLLKGSPVNWVHPGAPPFLLIHGENDTLIPVTQSEMLAHALQTDQDPVTLLLVEHAGHEYLPIGGTPSPSFEVLQHRIVQFFQQTLRA